MKGDMLAAIDVTLAPGGPVTISARRPEVEAQPLQAMPHRLSTPSTKLSTGEVKGLASAARVAPLAVMRPAFLKMGDNGRSYPHRRVSAYPRQGLHNAVNSHDFASSERL